MGRCPNDFWHPWTIVHCVYPTADTVRLVLLALDDSRDLLQPLRFALECTGSCQAQWCTWTRQFPSLPHLLHVGIARSNHRPVGTNLHRGRRSCSSKNSFYEFTQNQYVGADESNYQAKYNKSNDSLAISNLFSVIFQLFLMGTGLSFLD